MGYSFGDKLRGLAAAGAVMVLTMSAAHAQDNSELDLIRDRPSAVSTVAGTVSDAVSWSVDMLKAGLSQVTPPSPTQSATTFSDDDSLALVKLLGAAGYKLKEVENGVGIIPSVSFKFAMIRELSEADWDYLDGQLETSRVKDPGMYADLQRTIVSTVMSINSGEEYHVSELKVQVLPLPKVQFSVTPKIAALSEESSALMRAIQKIDRRVRGAAARMSSLTSTMGGKADRKGEDKGKAEWLAHGDWAMGGAALFIALAMMFPLLQLVRGGRQGDWSAISIALSGAAGGLWLIYGVIWSAWPLAVGGTMVLVMAGAVLAARHGARAKAAELVPALSES